MKNQYVGDIRDLFKYDLILRVMQESAVDKLLFIAMLTKDEENGDGGRTDYKKAKAGFLNKELVEHLRRYVNEEKRHLKHVENFFKIKGIEIQLILEPFSHSGRSAYFKRLEKEFLSDKLIFIDPDKGMEIENSDEKHILYDEIKYVYNSMTKSSILMIYQHIPREDRHAYFKKRCGELENATGNFPLYASDNQIAFFFLTKSKSARKNLENLVKKYKQEYPELI